MNNLIVIPSRYGSVRLPAKPLALIAGKPMVQWVYERAARSKLADKVLVATDSDKIVAVVRSFGGEAVITSPDIPSGTDRVAAVAGMTEAVRIINLQGDEPGIVPEVLDKIFLELETGGYDVVTPARAARNESEYLLVSRVKVVCDSKGRALYFSRSPIPRAREDEDQAAAVSASRIHLGVYGFKRECLMAFASLPIPEMEKIERLEQLRLLSAGYSIRVIDSPDFGDSIDTIQDLENFAKSQL
ncbi:MAG: 3-deoxy-manno-octulosonate cytidylyltransferase [Candidatus Brocadiia bacterium]